jgi:hypothetical protein
MNAATATAITNATNNNWGFKTPIQFRVALRLAGAFGHLWAEGRSELVQTRTSTPSGAVRLEENWVHTDPSSPAEAAKWAEEAPHQIGACYSEPTPRWESGSESFKVSVAPNGVTEMTLDGVLVVTLNAEGTPTGVKMAPNWVQNWTGRGENLAEALKNAIATLETGFRHALPASQALAEKAIEMFESDRQFWRTGFQVGRRWWI